MEGCVHHTLWALPTPGHVLQTMQLTPTFQAFMDSAFRGMIVEGWLVIYMDDVLVFMDTKEQCQEWTK